MPNIDMGMKAGEKMTSEEQWAIMLWRDVGHSLVDIVKMIQADALKHAIQPQSVYCRSCRMESAQVNETGAAYCNACGSQLETNFHLYDGRFCSKCCCDEMHWRRALKACGEPYRPQPTEDQNDSDTSDRTHSNVSGR